MKDKGNDSKKDVFNDITSYKSNSTANADWGAVSAELIGKLVDTVSSRGGAVRFGYTRDGGAYSLGLYYGSGHKTFYCRGGEDVEAFVNQWITFYDSLPYSAGASPDN